MKQRKTITVDSLKERANTFFKESDDGMTKERRALQIFIDFILMDTGNYSGFNYLGWLRGGCAQWEKDGKPANNSKYMGDETRIVFY